MISDIVLLDDLRRSKTIRNGRRRYRLKIVLARPLLALAAGSWQLAAVSGEGGRELGGDLRHRAKMGRLQGFGEYGRGGPRTECGIPRIVVPRTTADRVLNPAHCSAADDRGPSAESRGLWIYKITMEFADQHGDALAEFDPRTSAIRPR